MNERINELKRQAIIWCDENIPDADGYYGEVWEDKFAELIIRECANVAAEHDALDIYEEIREHFGVEE